MIIHVLDMANKTDKVVVVTMEMTGDYKAPVPQNVKFEVVNMENK